MNKPTNPDKNDAIEIGMELVDDDPQENSENLPDEIKIEQRSRELSSWFYRTLGIMVLILSFFIVVLVFVSYFYHPGQPDTTSLLIEQIVGYIFFGLGVVFGTASLFRARKLKEEIYDIELVNSEEEVDQVKIEEN